MADMSFGEIRREFWWGKHERMPPRYECENNIELYIKERIWESLEWIHLAQDRGSGDVLRRR